MRYSDTSEKKGGKGKGKTVRFTTLSWLVPPAIHHTPPFADFYKVHNKKKQTKIPFKILNSDF